MLLTRICVTVFAALLALVPADRLEFAHQLVDGAGPGAMRGYAHVSNQRKTGHGTVHGDQQKQQR